MSFAPWIAKIAAMRGLGDKVAESAAPTVLTAAKQTASAGTSPSGEVWKPKKDGKGAPLVNAPSAITVAVEGAVILLEVAGRHAFHSLGIGVPKRAIIPDTGDTIPKGIEVALVRAAEKVWAKL